MNVMVVGGGGREHAIIKKLKENQSIETIYALPGNGGIAADAVCVSEIGAKDIPAQVEFAKAHGIDYAVVAPDDPLALGAVDLKAYIESSPEIALDGCAGKIVSGFTWYYAGICSAKEGQKLLGTDGKPLRSGVEIRFPGQAETPLKATLQEVNIDEENDLTRFVLSCEVINGDVLRLNKANAQIIVGESTGLRIPASAVHYLKDDGSEAEGQGENYIPGVYVKYGNIARFCKIDPVDADHPQVQDGDHLIVLPSGTAGSVSQVRLYDEIIVSGQNLYDGKLL